MNLPLFLIPIAVGLITQLSKSLFNKNLYTRIEAMGLRVPRYGGMPSAHASYAFSLLTMVGIIDGITSVSFAVIASLTIFVIDDALRMRVFLGGHGRALHKLVQRLPVKERTDYPYLETHLGHKPAEVAVGAIVGASLTALILWFIPFCCGFIF